jgi:HEAT repeat protein
MAEPTDESSRREQVRSWLDAGVAVPEAEGRLREQGVDPQEASRIVNAALAAKPPRKSKKGWWAAGGVLAVVAQLVLVYLRMNQAANDPAALPRLPSFNPRAGLPPLEDSIRHLNDPAPEVRKAAANWIRQEARSVPGGLRPVPLTTLPGLLDAAGDGDGDVRAAASLCLGRIGPEAAPALLGALRRQQRKAVYWPCAAFGLDPFGKAAVAVVQDPLLPGRRRACVSFGLALGKIGEPALPRLLEGLRDPSSSVRLGAVMGLAVLGPKAKDAMPALLDLFGDRDVQVQTGAALALARIGKPSVAALAAKLKDKNPRVRLFAANALAHVGPTLPRQELDQIHNARGREGVQRRLQEQRAEAKAEAVPALALALQDESPEVRLSAADALMDFPAQRPAVAAALKELLRSPNRNVSRRAGEFLRRIDPDIAPRPAVGK